MRESIKMVVFDMAGTTVNEDNIVYKTLTNTINRVGGYLISLEDVLAHGAGMEKLQAIKSVLKNCLAVENNYLAEEIFKSFLEKLAQAYQTEAIYPCKNAIELFEVLGQKQIFRVLNTGYNRATAEALLAKLNWVVGRDIDALVTASDVKKARPFPDMIEFAMKQLGVESASAVLKVGDSSIDVREGKNAGCALNIGITTGAQTKSQLSVAKPEYIIDDLMELKTIIEKHNEH